VSLLNWIGVALTLAILWEVFSDLYRPAQSGALSDWIGRALFGALRLRRQCLGLAGPLSLIMVIAVWIAGLMLGFALMYLGHFPHEFRTSTGTVPPSAHEFTNVLYFSFETLITLGYGDLVPASTFTRFVATTEAVFGFGLLTASVSSIVLVFPALSRMRLLAREVGHVVKAEGVIGAGIAGIQPEVVARLARDLAMARIDLVHFPILYFFATTDAEASIARWTWELERIARESCDRRCSPQARAAGAILDAALDEFATVLRTRFLRCPANAERGTIFSAYAEHHAVSRRAA